MPYETPNGCVYDSGDYPRALDMVLELVGYDTIEGGGGGRLAREAARAGDRLDARLGDEQLRPVAAPQPRAPVLGEQRGRDVKLDIFGEIVVTLGTTPQGQGHETTAAQVVADILGCDVDIVHVRAGHDSYWNSHAGFSGTYASQFAVTGLGAVKGATDKLASDEDPRLDGLPVPGRGDRARGRVRADRRQPGGGPAVHGARGDPEREQRGVPDRPAAHERALRLPAAVRGPGQGAQVREPDADVRDADPRVRRRDRPGDGRLRDRRLRRRRRLRRAGQPADRRGPGHGRDRARDRRGDVRVVRLRRGGEPPHTQLLRLPRAPHARHAAAQDGAVESPSPFTPLGTKGMGEGGGGGIHASRPRSRTRCGRGRRDRDRQPQPLPPRLRAAHAPRSGPREGRGEVA